MSRLLVVAACLAACGKGEQPPRTAPANESAPPVTVKQKPQANDDGALSFVPASIASSLGDTNTLIAIDLTRLDLGKVAQLLRQELPCAANMLAGARTVVVGEGEGFVAGINESETRKCLAQLLPMFGGSLDREGLSIAGDRYTLIWNDGVLHVDRVGAQHPPLSRQQRSRVARVPSSAVGWVVSNGYPKYKINESLLWLETTATHWRITVLAEGTEARTARPWVASMVDGFRAGFTSKGIEVDDRWFELTSTDTHAQLIAAIPTSIFDQLQ
jgi:hypothetical protein